MKKTSEINLKTPERLAIFNAMRPLKTFTVHQIAAKTGIRREAIRSFVWVLTKAGYLRVVREGIYALTAAAKDMPDTIRDIPPPSGQQRMWAAMRVLRRFTALDLALPAEVDAKTARQYCAMLCKAQYLALRSGQQDGQAGVCYIFDRRRDTGYHAPQVRAGRTGKRIVYDRNLGRIVWPESEAA